MVTSSYEITDSWLTRLLIDDEGDWGRGMADNNPRAQILSRIMTII